MVRVVRVVRTEGVGESLRGAKIEREGAADLVLSVSAPDRFSTFYREHYGLVLTVAEHRLTSFHDAEEVASEAFRVAFRRHENGQELTLPWLYGVVRNLIGNEYRRRQRRSALQDRLESEHVVETDAVTTGEINEDSELVRSALASLPDAQQEVLTMIYWDELSMSETAAILGCGEGAIRVRVFRARKALARAVDRLERPDLAALSGGETR